MRQLKTEAGDISASQHSLGKKSTRIVHDGFLTIDFTPFWTSVDKRVQRLHRPQSKTLSMRWAINGAKGTEGIVFWLGKDSDDIADITHLIRLRGPLLGSILVAQRGRGICSFCLVHFFLQSIAVKNGQKAHTAASAMDLTIMINLNADPRGSAYMDCSLARGSDGRK